MDVCSTMYFADTSNPQWEVSVTQASPLGNSEVCFPRILMFPLTLSWETLRLSGNKIQCSPGDQSCSVKTMTAKTV